MTQILSPWYRLLYALLKVLADVNITRATAKYRLTAQDIVVLNELLNIQREIVTAQETINSYENPQFKIQLVPEYLYRQQIAVRDAAQQKLGRKLNALTNRQLHIEDAFKDAKQYVRPE